MTVHVDSIGEIGRISEQLQRSRSLAGSGEIGTARVATLNLIVHLDDAERFEWVVDRAMRVAAKHPSRLVILDATGRTTGVDVSTQTRQASSETVVSERVDVGCADLDAATIKSVTQEISVHDMPTVLWWTGATFAKNETFTTLAELATTVLVDSSGSRSDEETIRELAGFLALHPALVLRDLAFMRLAPWQDMIAQFFDDPALREDLFSITGVDVESGSDAEALYLVGWLGSRLSWEACAPDTFCTREGRRVPVRMTVRGERRRVASVTLHSVDSVYRAELSDDDENVVRLSVGGAKAKPSWLVPLQNIDNASLIERVILEAPHDSIFSTSLEAVRALLT